MIQCAKTCTPTFLQHNRKALLGKKLINNINHHITLSSFFFTANKETAFVHSISAAGVTYKLTHDCRTGKFKDCDCVRKKNKKEWSGCNDNVRFGDILARHFLDALEKEKKARSAMNLHNNEVGRKVNIVLMK